MIILTLLDTENLNITEIRETGLHKVVHTLYKNTADSNEKLHGLAKKLVKKLKEFHSKKSHKLMKEGEIQAELENNCELEETGIKARDTVRKRLFDIFMSNCENATKGKCAILAMQIDTRIFFIDDANIQELSNKYEDETQYKQKGMSIIFNLTQNAELREKLIKQIILPSELVSMDTKEMASKEVKEKREKDAKEAFDAYFLIKIAYFFIVEELIG